MEASTTSPTPVVSGQGIYLIAAHPDWRTSQVNRRLFSHARGLTPPPGRALDINDLYGSYPDYFIDVAAEQRRLAAAQLIILLHPIHWYSMPALQKLWLDEVLTYGWAYGAGDAGASDQTESHGRALRGKDLWLVATTGGSEEAYHPQGYNRYFFDAFLPPYEQTAALCGMRFLPPLLMHGAHARDTAELDAHVAVFGERLLSYPDWPEIDELASCPACEVPLSARPRVEPPHALVERRANHLPDGSNPAS